MKAMGRILIDFEGREIPFGDLNPNSRYHMLIMGEDNGSMNIRFSGNRGSIFAYLNKLLLTEQEALEILGYQIKIKRMVR